MDVVFSDKSILNTMYEIFNIMAYTTTNNLRGEWTCPFVDASSRLSKYPSNLTYSCFQLAKSDAYVRDLDRLEKESINYVTLYQVLSMVL